MKFFTTLVLLFAVFRGSTGVLSAAEKSASATVSAVLLSDPHFDPFRDPAKAVRLNAAPSTQWEAILSGPPSPDSTDALAKLQADCHESGIDAEHDLLLSSFDAAAAGSSSPAFVLVAGDLVVHRFDCRYHKLFANDPDVDRHLSEFTEKTIDYVVTQLKQRFPHTPVYVALGNNDTGCADYRLDADSAFLRHTGEAIAQGWGKSSDKEKLHAVEDFRHFGSYALTLPAPMRHTKLLVLNDLYLSADYKGTCAGAPNPQTATELLKWIEEQLIAAKRHGEKVWVLAHIPPGVNVYSTYRQNLDICHGVPPTSFLHSQAMADLLAKYAGTVRMFISGHTHIDEMHVLGHDERSTNRVALKTVPSISPISNNPPSFLTASVHPETAVMLDYQLHTASASTGKSIRWTTAYDFRKAYAEPAYDAASLRDLFHRFSVPDEANSPSITNYQEHAATGLRRIAMQAMWPQYICSMRHESGADFTECACQNGNAAALKP